MPTYELPDGDESLPATLAHTDIPGMKLVNRGKVRDIYDVSDGDGDRLLIITTDRISAFDFVLEPTIPQKGRALTQISLFWFDRLASIIPHHFLSEDISALPILPQLQRHLRGRSMLVKKARPLPVECIARGYLVGSGWSEYQKSGTVSGQKLPSGLPQAGKLPAPLFTPSTKAEQGAHDENIDFAQTRKILGDALAEKVREKTLALYTAAADYALTKGIIIADTKFEFGLLDHDELILIDEVLTPDSSRFWATDTYAVGKNPPSFDKQFVRDYLESCGWNKQPPAPRLPPAVVAQTTAKYVEAFERLTGKKLITN
ncbi:phosphoribosylaminoimidazole-succinocarboxamide synthase [Planctomycetales bacterium]|nr:phosphoribosylaminoimidazole-succinocarboxamide synthase [Planctomycetales bacterium]GHS97058.1 phosphoribosylaminoimidazole-succinocarboxamide synthase [Planctomycetales bacterium]GHT03851.1 phosphoribosylaminoimidazole-succinocarboxamide synthase [Planctomycetales bacterium]